MKTLVLITRVPLKDNREECCDYTGFDHNVEHCKCQPIILKFNDVNLYLIPGRLFRIQKTKSEILKEILSSYEITQLEETIVAYHDDMYWELEGLEKLRIIKRYGSKGSPLSQPVYKNYLIPLQKYLKTFRVSAVNEVEENKEIEDITIKLCDFFVGDMFLESALLLLHKCLTPIGLQSIKWESDYHVTFTDDIDFLLPSKFDIQCKSLFETLKSKSDGPFGPEYIKALSDLRDELLKDY